MIHLKNSECVVFGMIALCLGILGGDLLQRFSYTDIMMTGVAIAGTLLIVFLVLLGMQKTNSGRRRFQYWFEAFFLGKG
jgi:MFS-type transporter involved in bile tolerance (Atg22 family)